MKTEILDKGANSTLFIAKVNKSDSGNYTCSINSSHEFTVSVHVLNGKLVFCYGHEFSCTQSPEAIAAASADRDCAGETVRDLLAVKRRRRTATEHKRHHQPAQHYVLLYRWLVRQDARQC